MTTPDPALTSPPQPVTAVDISLVTDYADLGTAFGLDASVAHTTAAASAPVANEPAAPWQDRLARRRGL